MSNWSNTVPGDAPKFIASYSPTRLSPFSTKFIKREKLAIYKHLPLKYAELLASKGEIRIGSLSDFRVQENRDIARGDSGEGTYFVYVENYNSEIQGELSSLLIPSRHQPLTITARATNTDVSEINFGYETPDTYIYCASTSRSRSVGLEFGCGEVCVQIFDVDGFYRIVGRELNKHETLLRKEPELGSVQYLGRQGAMGRSSPKQTLPFIKESRHFSQSEIRAVWWPAVEPSWSFNGNMKRILEPVILKIPNLAKCCRLIDVDD